MGRLWLEELIFGKERLDRWDRERNGNQNLGYITQEQKRATDKNFFVNEFYKLGNGCTYLVEELPEFFKEVIIKKCGSLEKETLKNFCNCQIDYTNENKDNRGTIQLFSIDGFWKNNYTFGGFLYVEDNEGRWKLKTYSKHVHYMGDSG
ncbi:hypothetical protein HYS72_02235 [Candidatus Pacearchaeota archaeon]|nr:hypothetical protein [Candidatus Pacearchaeota archaeon]MBI2056669.1 hypothetical protein [Candidatus Pacearchaeota archaeon]